MEFKKLEIEPEGSWIKRTVSKPHFKKSLIYILAGAVLGFLFFYFTDGVHMDEMPMKDIFQSILLGGFFGFFITNSPCARGRC
jgi:RsiW-degrading membrane proteinase PrsW (M82 family)